MQSNEHDNFQLPAKLSDEDLVKAGENLLKDCSRTPFMSFDKNKYFVGEEEISAGTEFIAYLLDRRQGWVKFQAGGVIDDTHVCRVIDRPPMIDRDELGDLDQTEWERGPDGKPRDCWSFQRYLPLENIETNEFVVFVSGTAGGKIAIEKLTSPYARNLMAGRNLGRPTVRIEAGHTFKSKAFGEVPRPHFAIVSWEFDRQEDQVISPSKDLNDSIPF